MSKICVLKYFCLLAGFFPLIGHAAPVSITAQYREVANIFVIMDCVSGWWDKTFCQDRGAYQQEWSKRFGLSSQDQELFSQYDAIRNRYYRGLGLPKEDTGPYSDGIFAKRMSIHEDPIAPIFYQAETLDEAFKKLKTVITEKDLSFLKNFYQQFKPKYQKLLEESKPFVQKALRLNQSLSGRKYRDYFSKISKYYSVSEKLNYQVLFVWYPPLDKDFAFPVDQFLVLQKNPIKHNNLQDEDVVFHEIVHTLSVRQPQKQKEDISKIVLEQCPIRDKFKTGYQTKILEEPMAVVVGQIIFLKEFFPTRLKWDSKLYNDPWISAFAKNISPVIEDEFKRHEIFSVRTAKKLGFLCNEMSQVANLLNSSNKQ